MLKIGGIIKAQMAAKNLQQKDLAGMLKLNQRTISSYCNNISYPDLGTLAQICQLLDIDLNQLLEIEAKGEGDLIVQSDDEMKLLMAFRKIPEQKQKDFMRSFVKLAGLFDE